MLNGHRFFGLLTFVFAGLTLKWELLGGVSRFFPVFIPFLAVCLLWNIFVLLKTTALLQYPFWSVKTTISLTTLITILFVTCAPAITYSSIRNHAFNDLHWLTVSWPGFLFALSLMNYCLKKPGFGWPAGSYCLKKIWSLPPAVFMAIAFFWMLLVTVILSTLIFDNIPHVQDTIAQIFQARIFASGRVTVPLPPLPEFFQYFYDNMIFTDRWYSQYPPGHPFFLMLGLFIGAPWLVNPLFAAFSAVLLYKSAFYYFGEKEARISTLLFCVSPFILIMSASFMNHVSTLFFLLLALYTLRKALLCNGTGFALVTGLALGIIFNIRPGDGFALLFPLGLYLLIGSLKQRQYGLLAGFGVGFACMIAVALGYNFLTTGDPFLFGYTVRWGKGHTIGFSDIQVMGRPLHSYARGWMYTIRNAVALNQNLFEWPFPSMVPLYLLAVPYIFRKTYNDYFFFCGLLAGPAFYFFYFFQDLCLGPRFFYITLPFLLVLSARAILFLIERLSRRASKSSVIGMLLVLFCCSLIFAGSFRFPHLYHYYSDSFWDVDNDIMKAVKKQELSNVLVFQRSYEKSGNDLGQGLQHNTPDLNGPVIFARDLGERNAELMRFFPDRKYYMALRGPEGKVILRQIFPSAANPP